MNAMLDKGASANDVSDKIKEILFAKSAQRIDASKPDVATNVDLNKCISTDKP